MENIAGELWTACNRHGHKGMELEFRLGHHLPGCFSPNVGKVPFFRLKKQMDATFPRTSYIETIEKIGQVKHVSTVHLVQAGTPIPPPPPYCMTKTKVFQTDLEDLGPYTIRVGIALEKVVSQQTTNPRITRHKKRQRYFHKCWAFDLTEVVSNGDLDNEESYEVELELVDTGILFEKTMDFVVHWGLDLVKDVVRMLS